MLLINKLEAILRKVVSCLTVQCYPGIYTYLHELMEGFKFSVTILVLRAGIQTG
jgi:hypothetical protein